MPGAEQCDLLCLDLPKAEAVRAALPHDDQVTGAAAQARALGDPTRLRVALALAEGGELCGCDVSWIVGRAQNLVSHHLRALHDTGVVSSRRDGKMVLFELTGEGAHLVSTFSGHPARA